MKFEELKKEYDRLHDELVEQFAVTDDCGWTDEMENELYKTRASSYHKQYLNPESEEDLEELIRRVKNKIEENKKYLK